MAEFEIVEKEIGNVIEIENRVSMMKMAKTMGKSYSKIMSYIHINQTECSEAPYTRYPDIEWEHQTGKNIIRDISDMFFKKWHFFCGVPSGKKLHSSGDIISKILPKRKYVKAIHHGPYQKVGKLYSAMYKWIIENGHKPQKESIEYYTNDPSEVEEEEIETIVYIPIEQ